MVQNGSESDPRLIWFRFWTPCLQRFLWEPGRNNGLSRVELVREVGDAYSKFRWVSLNLCKSTSKRVPSQSRGFRSNLFAWLREANGGDLGLRADVATKTWKIWETVHLAPRVWSDKWGAMPNVSSGAGSQCERQTHTHTRPMYLLRRICKSRRHIRKTLVSERGQFSE